MSEGQHLTGGADRPADGGWLTAGVLSVGAASLCSDTSHEMVTSLLPTFLTVTLGAGPAALGTIDGVADALTGLAKLAGGPLAADPARRGRLAARGYLGTAAATALIGLATAIWQVAALRAVAWVSRGLRSPARDMLLTSLARGDSYGRAFGVERAGDNAGAVIGPLLASVLVVVLGVRHTILLALLPGLLAAAAITIAARQARRTLTVQRSRTTLRLNLGELRRAGLGRTLTPVAAFECGNLTNTLLILRATELLTTSTRSMTAATAAAILMYAAHNAAATAAAVAAGHLADRCGPRWVLVGAAASYVAAYAMFAAGPSGWPLVLVAFLLAGVGIGLAEPAASTAVAHSVPERLRANAFGVLGLIQSMGDLVATVIAGWLWAAGSPALAFGYAASWMLACLVTSGRLSTDPGRSAEGAAGTGAGSTT